MKLNMYIDGEWVESSSGEMAPLLSPATGEVVAEVPQGTVEDAKQAIRAANNAKEKIADMPVFDRARMLHAVADQLEKNKKELAPELSLEHGKPLHEARGEIHTAIEMWRDAAEDIKRLEGEVLPSSARSKQKNHDHQTTTWCHCRDYALELPPYHTHRVPLRRSGCGERGGMETGQHDADDCLSYGSILRGSRGSERRA